MKKIQSLLPLLLIVSILSLEASLPIAFAEISVPLKTSSEIGVIQIDHGEYDVSYTNNTSVLVNGTINHINTADTKVTITFILPDGSTTGSEIAASPQGYYVTKLPLDYNSQKGSYVVFASYAGQVIGKISFIVKQVSAFKPQFNSPPSLNLTNTVKPDFKVYEGPIIVINDNQTGGDCNFFGSWDQIHKTCFLRENIYKSVIIDSNGITLDGNQNILENPSNVIDQNGVPINGIYVNGKTGIMIKNLFCENFEYCILLTNSDFNTIENNTFYGNGYDSLNLNNSSGNKITDNVFNGYTQNRETNPHNALGILVTGSNHNTLQKNIVRQNYVGVQLDSSNYTTLEQNVITSNRVGISFQNSFNNSLDSNNILGNLVSDVEGKNYQQNASSSSAPQSQGNAGPTNNLPPATQTIVNPSQSENPNASSQPESASNGLWYFIGFLAIVGLTIFIVKRRQQDRTQQYLEALNSFSISDLDSLSGYDFEFFLKRLFELDGYKVQHTKLSGDYGADLIISKKGDRIAVQAKRYEANVNLKAVQEVVSSLKVYHANKGMVITNSEFTESAIKLAKLHNVDLIGRSDLQRMIRDVYNRHKKSEKINAKEN